MLYLVMSYEAAGSGEGGAGIMAAGQQAAMGKFLAFSRDQESSADQAGASFLNTAGISELMLLPRIGETTARKIVESREREGPFRNPEELRRIQGIGPATVERLRPYLLPIPQPGQTADRSPGADFPSTPPPEQESPPRALSN